MSAFYFFKGRPENNRDVRVGCSTDTTSRKLEDELEDKLEDCLVRKWQMSVLAVIFWTSLKKVNKTRTCQSSNSSTNSSSDFLDFFVGWAANADISVIFWTSLKKVKKCGHVHPLTLTCPHWCLPKKTSRKLEDELEDIFWVSEFLTSSNSSSNFLDVIVGRAVNADILIIFRTSLEKQKTRRQNNPLTHPLTHPLRF